MQFGVGCSLYWQNTSDWQTTLGCGGLMANFTHWKEFYSFRIEGFYLYRLLSNTFEEQQKLGFLLVFGWGTYRSPLN